jgi:hypothetical protein
MEEIGITRYRKAMDDICSMVVNSEEYLTKGDIVKKLIQTREQIDMYLELLRRDER